MVETVDAGTARDRLDQSAQGISSRYESGVNNPRRSWQEATSGATETWADGVRRAINNDQFATGVAGSSDAEWQEAASSLGSNRIGPGLRANLDDYEQSVAPFLQALQNTSLSARGPSGDLDQNLQRVREVAEALIQEKQG